MENKIEQLLEQLITTVNDESALDREKLLAIIEEVRAETAEHKASEKIAAARNAARSYGASQPGMLVTFSVVWRK